MSPLIWALKEGDGQKVEVWLEQVLSEQDPTKKDKVAETNLNLTTTIRSSSEEREATASGTPTAKDQYRRRGGKASSEGAIEQEAEHFTKVAGQDLRREPSMA